MMLEQEIEKYLSGQTLCNCDSVSYRNIKNLILGFAEPREKRIADLEKENAELKSDNTEWEKASDKWKSVYELTNSQLTKAKDIIKKYYKYNPSCEYFYEDIDKEAEQFLNEVEK